MVKGIAFPLFFALCLAICICEKEVKGDFALALGSALLATTIWNTKELKNTILMIILTTGSLFSIIFYVTSLDNLQEKGLLLFIICLLATFTNITYSRNRGDVVTSLSVWIPSFYIFYRGFSPNIKSYMNVTTDGWIDFDKILFYIVIITGFKISAKAVFSNVIKYENSTNKDEKILRQVKEVSYCKITALVIGIVVLLISWFCELANETQLAIFLSTQYSAKHMRLYLLCGIVLLLMFFTSIIKKRAATFVSIAGSILCVLLLLIVNYVFLTQVQVDPKTHYTFPGYILLSLTFFSSIGSAFLLSKGFYYNTTLLRGNEGNKNCRAISHILLISGLLIFVLNGFLLVFYFSPVGLAMALLNSIIIAELVPALCVLLLKVKENHTQEIVLCSTLDAVTQDGYCIILAQIFLTGVPCAFLFFLNKDNISSWVSLIVVMVSGMEVVYYFIVNNRNFVYKRKEEGHLIEFDDKLVEWFNLRKWISTQQKITVFTALPYFAVAIIIEVFKYYQNRWSENKDGNEDIMVHIEKAMFDKSKYEEDFVELEKNIIL